LKPPFRAEHIGSLLRPKALLEQRAKFGRGEIDQAALTAAEDQAIKDALALQERVGLKFATDGEFRRRSYHSFFYRQLGELSIDTVAGEDAKGGTPGHRAAQPVALINSRVRWSHPINLPDFKFIQANTRLVPKITIPGPCALHFRGGDAAVLASAYKDLEQFWDDTVVAFGHELNALSAAGCRYVQIDETAFAKFGDPEVQQWLKTRGDDWSALIDKYIAVTNRVLENAPAGMRIGMHLCRGNRGGQWHSEGSYDEVADRLFNALNIPFYFLEYHLDQDAGDGKQNRHEKARRGRHPPSRSRQSRDQPAMRLRQRRHRQSDFTGGAGAEAPAGGRTGQRHLG
jgi:5-methyltetrahydropteroyltriglutamate--homocysteine methyltransferase